MAAGGKRHAKRKRRCHTASNALDPARPLKLRGARPSQYWGGQLLRQSLAALREGFAQRLELATSFLACGAPHPQALWCESL